MTPVLVGLPFQQLLQLFSGSPTVAQADASLDQE